MGKYGRAGKATDGNTVQRMRFACWIPKATNTRSEYAIRIAIPLQKWLRERASMLVVHKLLVLLEVKISCVKNLDVA